MTAQALAGKGTKFGRFVLYRSAGIAQI